VKTFFRQKHDEALTLIEVLIVIAALAILTALLIPSLMRAKTRSELISCNNNLKQVGLAFRVWEGDNGDKFPMVISETNGGTMELVTGQNVFRHFQVMSNELSTPIVLICPAESDRMRVSGTNFNFISNFNISYFVGIDVTNDTNPQMILSGDRNITNGTPVKNGLLELTTNQLAGWTSETHKEVGNVALADGSVQQFGVHGLQDAVANTSLATNRLQMPILSP
jgi:competence protein ComGC